MSDQAQLEKLIEGRHPAISMVTHEEIYARQLVTNAAVNLKLPLRTWTVTEGIRDGLLANDESVPNTEHPAAGMLYMEKQHGAQLVMALDLIGHLDDTRTQRVVRDLIYRFDRMNSTLIMIDHLDNLPKPIEAYTVRFDLSLPDEEELENLALKQLRIINRDKPIAVGLSRKDLKVIIRNLRGLTRRQAEQIIIDTVAEDHSLNREDINRVLALKRQILHQDSLMEYVETPTELDQIGGLRRLKRWLDQRRNALSDEAAAFGIETPRGVLMLGVQGAGKSLCAKAIATAWQRPLLRMDVGALYDRYIGESEKRLRMLLRQAETMAPIILWIDEIEKAFAAAASRSTDGGLSQRMFGTLLTWMQEHTEPVFLVATANDIEALPPELLRKGRFDEIFFVDLPPFETRKEIFAIHLSKRKRQAEDFDLPQLAEASDGFSGAEIEQAIIAALHNAFSAGQQLTTDEMLSVLAASPPLSVTMAERVETLRQWAQGRCVPAE